MNRDYHLFLAIILIKTDQSGFSFFAPDKIPAQIAFDLTEFLETYLMVPIAREHLESAVRKILRDQQTIFDCPVAWMITMNEAVDSLRVLKTSERFIFLPSRSESVNLEFLDGWLDLNDAVQVLDEENFIN